MDYVFLALAIAGGVVLGAFGFMLLCSFISALYVEWETRRF